MTDITDQIDAMLLDWEAWHSGDIPYQDRLDLQRVMLMREPATLRALKMAVEWLEKLKAHHEIVSPNMPSGSRVMIDNALAAIARGLEAK